MLKQSVNWTTNGARSLVARGPTTHSANVCLPIRYRCLENTTCRRRLASALRCWQTRSGFPKTRLVSCNWCCPANRRRRNCPRMICAVWVAPSVPIAVAAEDAGAVVVGVAGPAGRVSGATKGIGSSSADRGLGASPHL